MDLEALRACLNAGPGGPEGVIGGLVTCLGPVWFLVGVAVFILIGIVLSILFGRSGRAVEQEHQRKEARHDEAEEQEKKLRESQKSWNRRLF